MMEGEGRYCLGVLGVSFWDALMGGQLEVVVLVPFLGGKCVLV